MANITKGYAHPTSVEPGGSLSVFLSSDVPGSCRLDFRRFYDDKIAFGQAFKCVPRVPGSEPWKGYGWQANDDLLNIPAGLKSGLYMSIDAGVWFVVKPTTISRSKTAVIMPVASINAYNGNHVYGTNWLIADRATEVSFLRPCHGFGASDGVYFLEAWAATQKLKDADGKPIDALDYFDYYSGMDLHENPKLLDGYNLVIIAGHDEYWSREMRDHVEAFVRGGGNLASFSGNTCHRQVRFADQTVGKTLYRNALMICRKDPTLYDEPQHSDDATQAFSEPPANRPPNTMLGVGFTWGGMSARSDPYKIAIPEPASHWVFKDLPASTLQSREFGTSLFVYEYDGAPLEHEDRGTARTNYWYPTGDEGTPLTFTPLAIADLRDDGAAKKPGLAVMGCFVRNGTVFTASTTHWTTNLTTHPDPAVKAITKTVLDRLKVRNDWSGWEDIGTAFNPMTMVAFAGSLYAVDQDTDDSGLRTLRRRHPIGAEIEWHKVTTEKWLPDLAKIEHLAVVGRQMFAATADGSVLHLLVTSEDRVGATPLKANKHFPAMRAFAGCGGFLYCVDNAGNLHFAAPGATELRWHPMPDNCVSKTRGPIAANPKIRTMTSYADALYAATHDHRLVRTNAEFVFESESWVDIGACFTAGNRATSALAVVDTMLFAAAGGRLLWKDLHHLRTPRRWLKSAEPKFPSSCDAMDGLPTV